MEDHDLTKSRLVHVGLAYLHHWDPRIPQNTELVELAWAAIRSAHCSMENHHPKFETAHRGPVDSLKLLVDRLSVHLQKDIPDNKLGWDVDEKWIPDKFKSVWDDFSDKFGHIDLYEEAFKPALGQLHWGIPYDHDYYLH